MSANFTCTQKVAFVCVSGYASAEANASIDASEYLVAKLAGSGNYSLASIPLGCICFAVGPVPIQIYPQINVTLDYNGAITVTTSTAVKTGGSIKFNSNSGFSTTSYGGSVPGNGSPAIVVTANGSMTIHVVPSVCLYAVLCGNFTANGTLNATASTAGNPYFSLCPSLNFTVGLMVKLLFWNNSNTQQIYSANYPCYVIQNVPAITLSVSPSNPTVPIGAAVQQFTAVSNAPPGPVTWSLVGGQLNDSITASGMLSVSAPGNRVLTVKVVKGALTATTTVKVGTTFAYGPPTNLTLTPTSPFNATVTWQAPVNTGGFPLIGYTVMITGHVIPIGGFNFGPQNFTYVFNTAATNVSIQTWSLHTWYAVTVYARNLALVASPPGTGVFNT